MQAVPYSTDPTFLFGGGSRFQTNYHYSHSYTTGFAAGGKMSAATQIYYTRCVRMLVHLFGTIEEYAMPAHDVHAWTLIAITTDQVHRSMLMPVCCVDSKIKPSQLQIWKRLTHIMT